MPCGLGGNSRRLPLPVSWFCFVSTCSCPVPGRRSESLIGEAGWLFHIVLEWFRLGCVVVRVHFWPLSGDL